MDHFAELFMRYYLVHTTDKLELHNSDFSLFINVMRSNMRHLIFFFFLGRTRDALVLTMRMFQNQVCFLTRTAPK